MIVSLSRNLNRKEIVNVFKKNIWNWTVCMWLRLWIVDCVVHVDSANWSQFHCTNIINFNQVCCSYALFFDFHSERQRRICQSQLLLSDVWMCARNFQNEIKSMNKNCEYNESMLHVRVCVSLCDCIGGHSYSIYVWESSTFFSYIPFGCVNCYYYCYGPSLVVVPRYVYRV